MVPDIAKKGCSFDGAFKYYLHDKRQEAEAHPTTSERVAWTETRNLMTDDPHVAKRIMIATALQADELKRQAGVKSTGRKSNAHVYAYSLAWHPDEAGTIDKAGMMDAVDQSLKALKAEHLQAVVVCHTDQDHPHVHVILNRVDMMDGRMHPFKNDRLILSDWANQYERDRGQIYTQAREEKRKKREQYQDQKKRQEYARKKREEAAARSKDKLSPAQMLKDLGDAQKIRHRQEWKDLSATNKKRRNAVYEEYRQIIRKAKELHRLKNKQKWRDHFVDEKKKRKAFYKRERALFGVVINALHATAVQHVQGKIDGRGQLSATFANVLSSDKRKSAFEDRLALDRKELAELIDAPFQTQVARLKVERTAALKDKRAMFDQERTALIQRQDEEWAKVREAWKQLKGRNYKPYQKKGADPVKKDWASKAPLDPKQPPPQPTRQAAIDTPSPAPSPSGEVPRATVKAQEVPTQDWRGVKIEAEAKGLSGTEPSKRDWNKIGAAPQKPVEPEKTSEPSKTLDVKKDWRNKGKDENTVPVKKDWDAKAKDTEQHQAKAPINAAEVWKTLDR